jgi:predicted ATPase/class 3 adenylate cyclase
MEQFTAYIPADRRHAMALGESLPERSAGTALFADVSGFTALTEALVRSLGPKRGADELAQQLNRVYDALIAEVNNYGGAVLSFAGDAITCWFDEGGRPKTADHSSTVRDSEISGQQSAVGDRPSASLRAAACALALQATMAPFASIPIAGAGTASLAIKVGLASGPVRRFLVGDPAIQTIDVLAGDTLRRMTEAEHRAASGEVLADTATTAALGDRALVAEWREDRETGERYALLTGLAAPVPAAPWPDMPDGAVNDAAARPWLLPPVYERLRGGMGEFLTELRPAAALFLRFGGIDYDGDSLAREKLDAFILWAQRILRAYDSYILQLAIGDKGSFLYATFGAPIAHEDDTIRAVMAALELREPRFDFLGPVQVGVSQGSCRTGAYGGATRRTYGVLGDEVNMAARLMQAAPGGQALVSEGVRRATGERFTWEALPPFSVKGKARPVTAYRLIGVNHATIRLHEPRYALPMVGRQPELALVLERLGLAMAGQGQVVGISAEAGMGKSRLVAEVVQAAWQRSLTVYGGECQSYGTNTPYLAWQNIWRSFFGLDPATDPDGQIGSLRIALARIDADLLPQLPVLGPVLGLPIPDNELTAGFDARLRKTALESLLVSCLAARSAELPLLIVLEDCHWLDALSHDLLEVVGRAAGAMSILVLMVYRPPQLPRLLAPRVADLPHFRELRLDSLVPEEVAALVRLKLGQFMGDVASVPTELVERVNARAQGNPFYVEELLNYLRDQGIDPREAAALVRTELPASLQSLILSRIDRLSESQQSLIKVASVVGRLFRATVLWGVASFYGQQELVRRELEQLSALELTPLDTPDPELTYLFKHVVTQEVTYESLPYATRAALHGQIAEHLERAAQGRDQPVDLLAFHYDRSENLLKRREYLLRAGAAAQAIYANPAALDYFRRALPLLEGRPRAELLLRLGAVLELVGEWAEATAHYGAALELATALGEPILLGQAEVALGELLRKRGEYEGARERYGRARAAFAAAGDRAGQARTISCDGSLAYQQGDLAGARRRFEECLEIRRLLDDQSEQAKALNNLGVVAWSEGAYAEARGFYERSLAIKRAENNKWAVANSLNNLSLLAQDQGDGQQARAAAEEAVALLREVGDRWALASALHVLGTVVVAQSDYPAGAAHYAEALRISHMLGDRYTTAYLLEDTGILAAQLGQPERALRLLAAAEALREAIGAPRKAQEQSRVDEAAALARETLTPAEAAAAASQGRALNTVLAVEEALQI